MKLYKYYCWWWISVSPESRKMLSNYDSKPPESKLGPVICILTGPAAASHAH